ERQYLRSAICATRSKAPRGPTVGHGPPDNLSHWHRCQWQGREGFRAQPVQGADRPLEAVRVGSVHSGGWPWIPTAPIDTGEETPTPVGFEREQNIVENRRGGRSAPTTVNSSVRTRE